MPANNDKLVILAVFSNEIEAQLLANTLLEHEISAVVAGGITSAFRAEAPGDVKVLVKQECVSQANAVLAEHNRQRSQLSPDDDIETEHYESGLRRFAWWTLLISELIGIPIGLLFWVGGETATAELIVGLVLSIGLIWIVVGRLKSSHR